MKSEAENLLQPVQLCVSQHFVFALSYIHEARNHFHNNLNVGHISFIIRE